MKLLFPFLMLLAAAAASTVPKTDIGTSGSSKMKTLLERQAKLMKTVIKLFKDEQAFIARMLLGGGGGSDSSSSEEDETEAGGDGGGEAPATMRPGAGGEGDSPPWVRASSGIIGQSQMDAFRSKYPVRSEPSFDMWNALRQQDGFMCRCGYKQSMNATHP